MERGGMTPKELRETVARRIDKALDGDCGYGVGEHLADALLPIFAEVRAQAIREARDAIMPPPNWNLRYDGTEEPGTTQIDGVYHDVHVELSEIADRIEKEGQA